MSHYGTKWRAKSSILFEWREDSYGLRKICVYIIVHCQEETFYKREKKEI
jgi:hypothetical protein